MHSNSGAGTANVWFAKISEHLHELEKMSELLSAEELSRAKKYRRCEDQNRATLARASLRCILSQELSCNPDELTFGTDGFGKPYLLTNGERREFNTSHSRDLVVVAVGKSRLGVDVEVPNLSLRRDEIVGTFFSRSEQRAYEHVSPIHRAQSFYKGWTSKEAYAKAAGLGLHMPFDSFDVCMDPRKSARILSPNLAFQSISLHTLTLGNSCANYVSVLAARSDLENVQVSPWRYQEFGQ